MSVDHGGEGPVSAADLAVNRWLLDGLAAAFPTAGWTLLSEETAAEMLVPGEPLEAEWLLILDPLDGTKDFLQGTGEYAVHLALVHGQRPVLGVVLLPEPEELWFGLVAAGDAGTGGEACARTGPVSAPPPPSAAAARSWCWWPAATTATIGWSSCWPSCGPPAAWR